MKDTFSGDNAALCRSIEALLSLDASGSLVPHGIGGHARGLLAACYVRLTDQGGEVQIFRAERDNLEAAFNRLAAPSNEGEGGPLFTSFVARSADRGESDTATSGGEPADCDSSAAQGKDAAPSGGQLLRFNGDTASASAIATWANGFQELDEGEPNASYITTDGVDAVSDLLLAVGDENVPVLVGDYVTREDCRFKVLRTVSPSVGGEDGPLYTGFIARRADQSASDTSISGGGATCGVQGAVPTDAERLDWLQAQGVSFGFQDIYEGNRWLIDGPFMFVRDAIDAAILLQHKAHVASWAYLLEWAALGGTPDETPKV